MSRFSQRPYGGDGGGEFGSGVEFADNPEPRCAVALLLDTSASMEGHAINELIGGVKRFKSEVMNDSLAAKRIEVSIVTFGPVEVHTDFTAVEYLDVDGIEAEYTTPMGEAVETGINLLNQRKMLYRQNGISYYRPWLFLISDGAPTDEWKQAVEMVRSGEEKKEFVFFAVGVDNANMEILNQFSVKRNALKLRGHCFKEMFLWLSQSLRQVSRSAVDDKLRLPNPGGPEGWTEID